MDIAHLANGKELESKVINAYIFTLVRKHNQENEDKAYMIDSFAMTKLWQGSYQIPRKCKEITSCGVFVCKFAEKILQDQPITFLNTDKKIELISVTSVVKRSTQVIQCSHLNGLPAMDVADGSTSHVLGTHKQKKIFIAQHLSTPPRSYSVVGETETRAELLKTQIERLIFQIQELIFSRDLDEALLREMTGILFQVLLCFGGAERRAELLKK
ncbi:hypothetical protein MHYP_G00258720 [Metynnis hypsauchen]